MADYEYDDFWVEFSPRAGKGYDVDARAPDGETARGEFELPFTDEQLEQAVHTLGSTRAATTTRDIGEVTAERRLTAEQLGGTLADALLSGPTGALYTAARSAAVAHGRGVRLWLSLGKAPGLLSVPWEFLYLQPTFLASQRKTPIVRFLRTDAPVAPRRIEKEVRILGVIASPDGLPKLKVDLERQRVDKALEKARQNREVTVDWLEPATPKALRLKLQEGDYHILHFIGHSGYTEDTEGADGGGVIFLENEDHSKAQISDSQLVNLLGDQDSLRLVVLNSCEGARTSVRDPFAGIATSIVALGIPAVVAMQFEITDDAAITFAEELYGSLIAREDPIDVAVAEARKAVFTEVNETEWATPVLFLRNEDGRLFDFVPVVPLPQPKKAEPEVPQPPPPKPQPWVQPTPKDRPAWLAIAVVAVAVVALLGGASALGMFTGTTATPTPGGSVAGADATPSEPTDTETPTAGATEPGQTIAPTPAGVVSTISPGEWVGPRPKSNRLALAAGHLDSSIHLSTVQPDAAASTAQAGVATSKAGIFDTDPTWDPTRNVLGFTRFFDDGSGAASSEILYVVPGVGKRPDGAVDAGIMVKDPLDDDRPSGTFDHAPGWALDRLLLFARTRGCPPGPDCVEDIVASEVRRDGDFIQTNTDRPSVVSEGWSQVRRISVERSSGRFIVVGQNLAAGDSGVAVWLVDQDGNRSRLAGSDGAQYAVFAEQGTIVALLGGTTVGWGPTIAVWTSFDVPVPQFIDAFAVLGGLAGTRNVPTAAEAEFGWLSPSPLRDGWAAVLLRNGSEQTDDPVRLPVIGLIDADGRLSFVMTPKPPKGETWKQYYALGW